MSGFLAFVGMTAADGVARVTLDERHAGTPPVGHGGLSLALCEAAIASLGEGAPISLHAQLLAPVWRGETMTAHAAVARRTRTLAFVDAEARAGDRLIARARAVLENG